MKRAATQPLRDALREAHVFRIRAAVAFLLICVCFLILAGRFFYLQVLRHDEFITRSEANRVKLRALPPNRGLIFDRNGVLLADNRPAYRLELTPEQVPDVETTLATLQTMLALSDEDIDRFRQLREVRHSFQAIPLRLRLSDEEVARFAVNRHRLPGVDIVPYQTRVYPFGNDVAHVIGYVSRLDARDLNTVDSSQYAATSHIGKTGLERSYETLLHGRVGHERVETNAQGRVLQVLERHPPVAGQDLYLSIDIRLQQAANQALASYAGAVVAIDPRNGELLAMASMPAFEPNAFVNGVSATYFEELRTSNKDPLFNRALQGVYEPGSTLKPYIGLAGLELSVIDQEHTVFSRGYYQLPGQDRRYHDWKKEGHGRVDIVQALSQSVNVFFYRLAVDLGIDRINTYLASFGFGQPTGIDLRNENRGILPSRAWKREKYGLPWFPGETVITGIGQGFTVATPLQLAQGVAAIAARGLRNTPHLLLRSRDPQSAYFLTPSYHSQHIPIRDARNWETIINGMVEVVHGARGTARGIVVSQPPTYRMAGKTGTAQVYGLDEDEEYIEAEVAEHLRDHALFIAFAPADAPRIAVAVVAEHGGGGARVAAPVARLVIDTWLQIDQ